MLMSLKPYAYHSIRRIAGAGTAAALIWMALASSTGSCAKQEDDVDSADPLSRAKRNVVAIVDWDRAEGKSVLGSGILLQRDKALIPCRVAGTIRNLGVSQGQRRSPAQLIDERAGRGLCELKITHPVHFDPLPLEIRAVRSARRMRLRLDSARGVLKLTCPPRTSRRTAVRWARSSTKPSTRMVPPSPSKGSAYTPVTPRASS